MCVGVYYLVYLATRAYISNLTVLAFENVPHILINLLILI